jgi:thymidylate synthase (FAD)
MGVKLIHRTEKAEKLIGYMARVSSPNQDNPSVDKLIAYLIKHNHWSPLEMANFCVEIKTSRAIAQQILRHRSFSFQEFSQRYAKVDGADFEYYEARRQDDKNRQNSIADLSEEVQDWFLAAQQQVTDLASKLYYEALNKGIAKECSRFLLPLNTETKLYMNGTLRSWVHYFLVRCEKSTQLEHREIALAAWNIFKQEFPIIAKAVIDLYPDILN